MTVLIYELCPSIRSHLFKMFCVYLSDHAEKQKLIDDAMFKLEHGEKDKRKSKAAIPGLVQIKVSPT